MEYESPPLMPGNDKNRRLNLTGSVNCQLDDQADGMRYVHRVASPFLRGGRVGVYYGQLTIVWPPTPHLSPLPFGPRGEAS
jgi:hypothetical protein